MNPSRAKPTDTPNTPLHSASGNLELTKALLEHQADANATNYHGMTPLHNLLLTHMEPSEDFIECLKMLIEHDADVNAEVTSSSEIFSSRLPMDLLRFADNAPSLEAKQILRDAGAKETESTPPKDSGE